MNWEELLELPSIKVTKVENQSSKLLIYLEFTNGSAVCPRCGSNCDQRHSSREKIIKDLPILKKKLYLKFSHRRFYCKNCDKTFMERISWLAPYEHYTTRYADWVDEAGKEIDVKKVANLLKEKYKVVERIIYYRNKTLDLAPQNKLPKRFGIDEFSYRKGKKDYGVAIGKKGKLIDILPSRKEQSLRKYFSSIDKKIRESVEVVTMDFWSTFNNLAAEFFPNAAIVNDRFHVMGLMNKVVDKIRKTVQKKLGKHENKELKGLRWILLKNKENLDDDQLALLKKSYGYSSILHKAHLRKTEFRYIFEKNTDKKKAEFQLDEWITKAEKIKHRSMTTFLKTLKKRKQNVLNYFDHLENNGFMEGIVNKIKTIKRQHYGMTNFGHFRKKVLLSFT